MKHFALLLVGSVALLSFAAVSRAEVVAQEKRPNILWLFQEDLSPWLGCYGYEIQRGATPNIDAMAAQGVRFSRAYVPAPVCSICRSAIITGANQIRFGAHEHRSRRGAASLPLPKDMKTIPELMQEVGYFCFNVGKTDYNFEHASLYSNIPGNLRKTPWQACPEGKPFFGQIQLKGGKLNTTRFKNKVDRSLVSIPADYPQNELYRDVVAEHFDSARMDDGNIGEILARLKADGLADSTIVVYFSDHGANNLVRHKQQPTEGGSHVPFIIQGPAPWVPAPAVRDDLVSMLDLSATTLAWAGIEQPPWMEGQDLFGAVVKPREFVATARDRCDQAIDRIRSIRTDRFRFTRNYLLDRVLLQHQYRDSRPFLVSLRKSYADGSLDAKLANIYFGERPYEEFYDVKIDPAQINNLIEDPNHAKEVARHRMLLDQWLAKGDTGAGNESDLELRMASNKKWGIGVNAEYEKLRADRDGDGLSDQWESFNQRDPDDGKLLFTFDCGSWQTEGWVADGRLTNIAGRQGFLEFELVDGNGAIMRSQLNIDPGLNPGNLQISLRSSKPTKIEVLVNGTRRSETRVDHTLEYSTIELGTLEDNNEPIRSLRLNFSSRPETKVEIDWIKTGHTSEPGGK